MLLQCLDMTIAERIMKLLKARGVEQRAIHMELATLCGITKQAVGQWFIGNTKRIDPEHLAKIAGKYHTSLEWLITGRGDMDAKSVQTSIDIELDDLIGMLYRRQDQLTAEQHSAIQSLLNDLQRRASARFLKLSQSDDQE